MGRFWKKTPKKGMPISTPGFAEGLAAIERALDRMDIAGGYVDWQDGVPVLVPPSIAGVEKEHNELEGLQGGSEVGDAYYHLSKKEYDAAQEIAGTTPEVLPPCGHPGNLPGGGPGGDDEHPGDLPGGGPGGDDEHPGDSPSPPSSGECP